MGISTQLRQYDRVAAGLGLVVAIALLPLPLFISQIYAKTLPAVLGLASLAYLIGQRGETKAGEIAITLPKSVTHALPGVTVLGSALVILVAQFSGGRTPLVLVIAAAVGTLVLGQIFFTREEDLHPGFVMVQVLVLAFAIRFSALFTTAGYIGLDVWEHVPNFTAGMLKAHSISGMGQTKYVMAPLFHLLVGTMSLFGHFSLQNALPLAVGFVMVISIAFVYLAARLLVPERWALFAVTLYAVSGTVTRWGIHLIPSSLGLAFFLVIVYFIVRVLQLETGLRDTAILLFFFIALALTHQVSAFITLVFLAAGWFTRLVIGTGLLDDQLAAAKNLQTGNIEAIPFGGYFAFNLGLLTLTWSLTPYYGESFLRTALDFLISAIQTKGGPQLTPAAGSPTPTLIQNIVLNFDVIGFLLFFFATTVGCLYALRKGRATQAVLTLVTAVVVMTAFTLLPPVLGVGTFLAGRWFAFLFVVMAILSAIGFDYLKRGLSPTVFLVVLLVFAYMFPMVMIASPKGTVDNPVASTMQAKYNFNEQEIVARQTIRQYADPTGSDPIATDNPYGIMLNNLNEQKFVVATVPPGAAVQNNRVLYRKYQTSGAPYFSNGPKSMRNTTARKSSRIYRVNPSVMCGKNDEVVYNNGDVRLCRTR